MRTGTHACENLVLPTAEFQHCDNLRANKELELSNILTMSAESAENAEKL
jgi:hypothetical protein